MPDGLWLSKGDSKGDRGSAKPPSKACVIKSLSQELEGKQQVYHKLKQENISLRIREVMMMNRVLYGALRAGTAFDT